MSDWYQLQIENCLQADIESFSDYLMELGALSVTLCDKEDAPILEPLPGTMPLWQSVVIKALFDDMGQLKRIKEILTTQHSQLSVSERHIADKDWQRACINDIHPMQFGQRLWICPSWTPPPCPDAVNIMLDPGLAFGTGTHPTTALCLEWLEKNDLIEKKIIDFGCGSGILAIAALKLGASHVNAVDIDPQALISCKTNARNNEIALDKLSISEPQLATSRADILLANILYNPLKELKSDFLNRLNNRGTLVMSGLLNSQLQEIIKHYQSDFSINYTRDLNEWCLVCASKK
jgi:ribosomal protein L11 methyltransferase